MKKPKGGKRITSKRKEQACQRVARDLTKITAENKTEKTNELPFPECYGSRALGVILDSRWIFEEHVKELKTKPKQG